MKMNRVFRWLMAAAFAASLPLAARATSGHQMGGFTGGGFHGSSAHGFNHQFGPHPGFHRFAGHNQFFPNNHRFFFNRSFFFGFDVVAFGFPYWWYPDYYYGYSNSYAEYEASPLYDYRYWAGMATAVQTELANRGYYHESIDGVIGPDSREAIRAFQKANNLPVSGLIDPRLLKALKLPPVPRIALLDQSSSRHTG
jgi:Putative peptidoglycan binding domain